MFLKKLIFVAVLLAANSLAQEKVGFDFIKVRTYYSFYYNELSF